MARSKRSAEDLQAAAVTELRRLREVEGDARTNVLRRVAEIVVELREHFTDDRGEVDWTGRTYPYRQIVSSVFAQGGIAAEEAPAVRASIRYHVSNVLHERLSPEDLERTGLRSESARERARETRAHRSEIIEGTRRRAPGDVIAAATELLAPVLPSQLTTLPARERKVALGRLHELAQKIAALSAAIDGGAIVVGEHAAAVRRKRG